jgi:hypothetical protein
MYDPETGRWTTQDPIGFSAGDYNLFRYVGNNPTNLTDPSGLAAPPPPRPVPQSEEFRVGKTGRRLSIEQKNKDAPTDPKAKAIYESDVSITFFADKKKDRCSEIVFVQIARIVTEDGKAVAPTQAALRTRATKSGWFVDRPENRKYGWYGYDNDGTPDDNLVQPGSTKPNYAAAALTDVPGAVSTKTAVKQEFETVVICKSGDDENVILGCIRWGFDVDKNGKLKSHPRTVTEKPTPDFFEAV